MTMSEPVGPTLAAAMLQGDVDMLDERRRELMAQEEELLGKAARVRRRREDTEEQLTARRASLAVVEAAGVRIDRDANGLVTVSVERLPAAGEQAAPLWSDAPWSHASSERRNDR